MLPDIPITLVLAAPLAETTQPSEFALLTLGEIALGGFDRIVDLELALVVTVDFDVASVTIGSAAIAENDMHQKAITITQAYRLFRRRWLINQLPNLQSLNQLLL